MSADKSEATRLADALCSEPVNSIDAAQRRGHLGSPSEWRNACRLFRARCSPEDASRMARLRAYIEDGLLEVVRPTAPPDQSARIAALENSLAERDRVIEQARVALERIRHATAPTHDDGGHHEAAHDLSIDALRAIDEVRK